MRMGGGAGVPDRDPDVDLLLRPSGSSRAKGQTVRFNSTPLQDASVGFGLQISFPKKGLSVWEIALRGA